jgi:hypothetical protein
MPEHLQDFLKEIPRLLKIVNSQQPLCLLLNYDELLNNYQTNSRAIMAKFFTLSDCSRLFCGIISRKPLEELYSIHLSDKIILAGSLGLEIDSPIFGWHYPQLALLRHYFDKTYTALELELGPKWTRENTIRNGVELKISAPQSEIATQQQIVQIIKDSINALPLQIIQAQTTIRVVLAADWDKSKCIEKIFSLLPRQSGQSPILCYFGAALSDEPAFRQANLYGYSILLRENIGRQTLAHYYIRNIAELNKLLICLSN